MGTAEHIESSTGTKPKDFNYKLTHKGDMAVKMSEVSPDTIFVHSVVLTDSDVRNDEIFAYLRKVWGKLEPEEVTDSLAKNAEAEEFENNLLFDKDNGDVTFDLFGDSDDSGFSNINVGNVKNVEDNSSENTSFDDIFN